MSEQLPEDQIIEQAEENNSPDRLNFLSRMYERAKNLTLRQRIILATLLAALVAAPGAYTVFNDSGSNDEDMYEVLKDKTKYPPSRKIKLTPEQKKDLNNPDVKPQDNDSENKGGDDPADRNPDHDEKYTEVSFA
jgi:hypothetical protein